MSPPSCVRARSGASATYTNFIGIVAVKAHDAETVRLRAGHVRAAVGFQDARKSAGDLAIQGRVPSV